MKVISLITLGIIFLALFISISLAGSPVFLIGTPYVVMLALLGWINHKKAGRSSHIAMFISTTLFSVVSVITFYQAVYNPQSSTNGLVFLILPIFSTFLFVPIYILFRTIIGFILKEPHFTIEDTLIKKIAIVFAVVFIIYIAYSYFSPASSDSEAFQSKIGFTNGDIEKSKKLGVFVSTFAAKPMCF